MPLQNFTIEYGLTVGNANINAASGNIQTSGNITANNINVTNVISVTGNANVGNLGTASGVFTGAITGSTTLNVTGNANVGNLGTAGLITATGNITGGNLTTAGRVTANNLGDSTQGITVSSSSAGGVTLGGYADNTGILYFSNGAGRLNSNAANFSWNNSSKVLTIAGGNLSVGNINNVSGILSVTGNANVGNIGATRGVFSSNAAATSTASGAVTVAGGIGIAGNAYIGGDVNIDGNLFVTGNSTIVNANDVTIADKTFILANNASTGAAADGSGIITGNVAGNAQVASLLFNNATTSWQSSVGITPIGNASLNFGGSNNHWNNIYGANLYGTIATASQTNITAVGTLGSLSVTGNITSGNVSGTRGAFTNVVGTLETASQPNITGLGTLTTLTVSGNITSQSNLVVNSNISAGNINNVSGILNVTGNANVGNLGTAGLISAVGNISGGNLTTTGALNVTGNANVGNIGATRGVFTNISGTLQTASQTNITSLGTLTSLTVSGNVSAGNLSVTGISNLGAVGNVTITGGTNGQFLQTNGSGVLSFATISTSSITNGTSNISIPVANGNVNTSVGGVANVFVVTSTGANVTGTANVSGLASVGNTLTVNYGNVATAIANGGGAGVGNIGAAGQGFDTLFARQASANYADLAEIYAADGFYEYGTVMVFGGSAEITISTVSHDTRIAGVVSQQPAFLMNDTASGIPLALTGRVPCRVLGPVSKGTLLVSSHLPGIACALDSDQYQPGCVIGKSLGEIADSSIQLIEAVVGRL